MMLFEERNLIVLLGLIFLLVHWSFMYLDCYMVERNISELRVVTYLFNLAMLLTYFFCMAYVPAVNLLDFALRCLAVFNAIFMLLIFINELKVDEYTGGEAKGYTRFNLYFGVGALVIAVVLNSAGKLI